MIKYFVKISLQVDKESESSLYEGRKITKATQKTDTRTKKLDDSRLKLLFNLPKVLILCKFNLL